MTIRSDDLLLQSAPGTARRKPRLFVWAAVIALAVVVVGFARTYYLRVFFEVRDISALVHLHGLVMTLWFGILVAQVALVARGNVAMHRKLGMLGMGVAVAVLLVGTVTAIVAVRNGGGPPGIPPLAFLAIPLGDMVVFALLVGLGFGYRRRPDFHKRFMIAASLGIVTAAIARLQFIPGGLPAFFLLTDAILIAVIAADSIGNRRLHPAFAIGLAVVLLSQVGRFLLAGTPQWMQFARWLTS